MHTHRSRAAVIGLGLLSLIGILTVLVAIPAALWTFGGNPLATAVGNAVLTEIEESGLLENVTRRGAELPEAVAAMPLVTGTRGAGLLIGITLSAPVATAVREAAQRRGLIVNAPTAEVIRIAPAYTIGDAEIDEFTTLFSAALAEVAASDPKENA